MNDYEKKCGKLIKKLFYEPFYFTHSTKNINSLKSIITDKTIKISKLTKERKLSGSKAQPYVFGNIQFDSIDNIKKPMNFTLLLHPKIMFDMEILFNNAWYASPHKTSINVEKDNIKKIRKSVSVKKINLPNVLEHEILFAKNIKLKDNLIGIMCEKKYIDKINDLLKNTIFEKVSVYDLSDGMPKLINLLIKI